MKPLEIFAHRVRARLSPSVVVSYPKSGRTWLRVLLHELSLRTPFTHAGSSEEQAALFEELPPAIDYWRRKRVLFLLRDPRDTLVSSWFQATRRSRVYEGSLQEYLRDPRFGIEKIVRFHRLWLDSRQTFPDLLPLSYEALLREPEQEFRRAVSFLTRRDPLQELLTAAVERASFASMRRLEAGGTGKALFGLRLVPGDAGDPESFKTRRGVAGGWRDYFSDEDTGYAEAVFERHDYRTCLETHLVPQG